MITEYMNSREVIREIDKEREEVEGRILRFARDGCKSSRRAGAKFPVTHNFTFVSQKHNKYVCNVTFANRSDAINVRCITAYAVIIPRTDGRYEVCTVSKDTVGFDAKTIYGLAFKFNPHVFSRYAERTHKEHLHGEELIKEFFKKNVILSKKVDYIPTKEHPNSNLVLCCEGALLGEMDDKGFFCYKTFIANETMTHGMKASLNSDFDEDVEWIRMQSTDKNVRKAMDAYNFKRVAV